MRLSELCKGDRARIVSLSGDRLTKRRIMDIGLLPGICLEMVKFSPFGDPMQISTRDFDVIIRKRDAYNIEIVKEVDE